MMSQKPFTRTEQMSCEYQGRTKGEGCGHVKSISVPSKVFNDRAASDLGLHCLPMSHLWDARLKWVKEGIKKCYP